MHLYNCVYRNKFQLTLEVGLAMGTSAVYICQAMQDWTREAHEANASAKSAMCRHIAVDPNQHTQYKGIGVHSVSRAALSPYLQLVQEPSFRGLPMVLLKDYGKVGANCAST
jgi:hypothetical protein